MHLTGIVIIAVNALIFLMTLRTKPRKSIALLFKWMIECFNGNRTFVLLTRFLRDTMRICKTMENIRKPKIHWIPFMLCVDILVDFWQIAFKRKAKGMSRQPMIIFCVWHHHMMFFSLFFFQLDSSIRSGRLIVVKVIETAHMKVNLTDFIDLFVGNVIGHFKFSLIKIPYWMKLNNELLSRITLYGSNNENQNFVFRRIRINLTFTWMIIIIISSHLSWQY